MKKLRSATPKRKKIKKRFASNTKLITFATPTNGNDTESKNRTRSAMQLGKNKKY